MSDNTNNTTNTDTNRAPSARTVQTVVDFFHQLMQGQSLQHTGQEAPLTSTPTGEEATPEAANTTPAQPRILLPSSSDPSPHSPTGQKEGGATTTSTTTGDNTTTSRLPPPLPPLKGVIVDLATSTKKSILQAFQTWNGWIKTYETDHRELTYHIMAQHEFVALLAIHGADNRLRLIHSLGKYCSPNPNDRLGDKFIAFRGDKVRSKCPTPMVFNPIWLATREHYACLPESVTAHDDTNNIIVPLTTTLKANKATTPRVVAIPLQWAPCVLQRQPSVKEFFNYVTEALNETDEETLNAAEYLLQWFKCALLSEGTTGVAKTKSGLSIDASDIDHTTEHFEEWEARHLNFHFNTKDSTTATSQPPTTGPIVVNLPPTKMNELDAAYLRGVDTAKRLHDTSVPTGTKYNERQLARIMGFCGLKSADRHDLPTLWTDLQKAKDWRDAMTVMSNCFRDLPLDAEFDVFWHKENVQDVWRLNLAHSQPCRAETAHRGITPLAFSSLENYEQGRLLAQNKAEDIATHTTVADVKASKRKCPLPPTTSDGALRLLKQYVLIGQRFFTTNNSHFQEVDYIRQGLLALRQRNSNYLSPAFIADLIWEISVDACAYFSTYAEVTDVTTGTNYPVSRLTGIRSLITSNQRLTTMDTPPSWLPKKKPTKPSPWLGASSDQEPGKGDGGNLLGGRFQPPPGGRIKRKVNEGEGSTLQNKDMHPVLYRVMKRLYDRKLTVVMRQILKAAGIKNISELPAHPAGLKICFRWILGCCGTGGDTCSFMADNLHIGSKDIPDAYAGELARLLQPGVDKIIKEYDEEEAKKQQRK